MNAPSFCIGVPTYKRADDLERFLAAIQPQIIRKPNVRLVVVNDASHNDAYQKLIEGHDAWFEYLVLPENSGPALSRQAAFAGADEDYLVTTDDDCLPGPDWLDYLEAIVVADRFIDVVAGNIEPVWRSKPGLWARLIAARSNYPGPVVTDYGLLTAVGANSAFRRTLFEQIGGYEPELRGAADDCCLTQRAIRAGGRQLVAWNWFTGHKAETSIREISKRAFSYGFGSAQYTLLEQDWVLAKMCSDGTFTGAFQTVRRKVRTQWADCRAQNLSWVVAVCFSGIALLRSIQFERGWRKGHRTFSKIYKCSLPAPPAVESIAVDFSGEEECRHALGPA